MRCLRFLILFLGLLGLSFAAPNGGDSQRAFILDRCRRIFKTACVLPTGPVATQLRIHESNCVCVPRSQCSQPSKTDERYLSEARMNNSETPINTGGFQECERWDHICCDGPYIDSGTQHITITPAVSNGCGYRNSGGILLRITDTANEAQFAEFPWMVAILQSVSNGPRRKKFKCGGAIIHPRAVLTAAHNVENFLENPTDLIVRAGEWDTYSLTEMIPHQERRVRTIILHENFNTNNLNNDFAILILETAFDIAQNVDTICLPQETDVFDGARCVVTGWGKDKAGKGGKFQAILKKIELPVLTYDVCQTSLRSTRLGGLFKLGQSFICAGGENNQDTCMGDGGGPLVCPMPNDPDRYVQAGIVSWGIGCGQAGIPGVYASVAYARQWIDNKLALFNLDARQGKNLIPLSPENIF